MSRTPFCALCSLAVLHDAFTKHLVGQAARKAVALWPQKRQGCAWPAPTKYHSWALWKAAKDVGVEEFWRQHGCGQPKHKQANQKPRVTKTCVLNVRMPSVRDVLLVKIKHETACSQIFCALRIAANSWRSLLISGFEGSIQAKCLKTPESVFLCIFLRSLNPASDLKRALRSNNVSFIVFLEMGRKSWKKPHDLTLKVIIHLTLTHSLPSNEPALLVLVFLYHILSACRNL